MLGPTTLMWRGRFAPSPTGPLHAGSLLAAVASYVDSKSRGGEWLLRIDDIDTLRNVDGAEASILNSLEHHGLHWDGPIERQTDPQAQARYADALQQLLATKPPCLFYCQCRRRDRNTKDGRYSGKCRQQLTPPAGDFAIRLAVGDGFCEFNDRILGPQRLSYPALGDVIIKRKDGIYAYQLAVVVDDAAAQINTVTRGADLLSSTAWQILLQHQLKLPQPEYAHLPLLVDKHGDKLSKQQQAAPIDDRQALNNLHKALLQLGQTIDGIHHYGDCEALLADACQRWDITKIPKGDITTAP